MGSRFSQVWRQTINEQAMSQSDHSNINDDTSEEEENQTLSMILTLAMLRGNRLNFSSTNMSGYSEIINTPCPDKIAESDLYQTVLTNQGILSQEKLAAKHSSQILTMRQREIHCCKSGKSGPFTLGLCTKLSNHYIPNEVENDLNFQEKMFCGTYSKDGKLFLSACQDCHIRIFDSATFGKCEPIKDIRARDIGWSVLDVAFSSDSRFIAYSSWSPNIHLCSVFDNGDPSLEKHEALALDPEFHSFAVFSLQFTENNSEIVCGTNDGCLYIYNLDIGERILKIDAHEDDINAVCLADSHSHIIYSGGDDGLVKVWDRRMLSDTVTTPVGTLAGHHDGITFIDSIGDARYLLSNCKDQSIKLWDIRCFSSDDAIQKVRQAVANQTWDYRWESFPRPSNQRRNKLTIPGDSSVFTYTGHRVLNTLIRARFSPAFSTGNKYIYTGCSTGKFFVYDILTGEVVSKLKRHTRAVRDVSWHPYEQSLITSGWEGAVKLWKYKSSDSDLF